MEKKEEAEFSEQGQGRGSEAVSKKDMKQETRRADSKKKNQPRLGGEQKRPETASGQEKSCETKSYRSASELETVDSVGTREKVVKKNDDYTIKNADGAKPWK